ncbi:MAG: hypothetical protein AAF679_04705 [Pseudomonadota bacterium]
MRAVVLTVVLLAAGCTLEPGSSATRSSNQYDLTVTENVGLFRKLTLRGPNGLVCRAPARPNSYVGPVRGTGTCNTGERWSYDLRGRNQYLGFRHGVRGEVTVNNVPVPARLRVDHHLGGLPFPNGQFFSGHK